MKLHQRNYAAGLTWCVVLLISAIVVPAPLVSQDRRNSAKSALRKKADEIRASASGLLKLQKIPWITDPAEGFRLAKEENRPVFLYLQVGNPLEDC
jgi:hypothetical protein